MASSGELKFKNAVRLHRSGDYRAALQSYLALLEDPVLEPEVACNLSALGLQLGDEAEAERYARLCVARKPGHANGWNHLGLALRARGEAAEAAAAFKRAISLDSGHAQAFANLAEICAEQDDIPAAIKCYERALAIDPELTIALVGYVHRKQQIADWAGLDAALARLSRQIWNGEPAVDPFMLLFCCTNPREILKACPR